MPFFRQPFYLAGFFNTLPPNRPLPKNATIAFFLVSSFLPPRSSYFPLLMGFSSLLGAKKSVLSLSSPKWLQISLSSFSKLGWIYLALTMAAT